VRLHLAGIPAQVAADAGVRMHLAGGTGGHYSVDRDMRIGVEAINRNRYPYHLITFAYAKERRELMPAWRHHPCTVMIDSGAFTAYTQGKHISLAKYAQFIRDFERICPDVAESVFVSLDVIGDQAATWTNYRRLVDRGCEVLPVVTMGAGMDDVRRAVDAYPYICLGGLVGRGQAAFDWLDQVYDTLAALPDLPRTHLLGIATRRAVLRYPCFSTDSSSWLSPFRWGGQLRSGHRLPNYHESHQASAAMRHHMSGVVAGYARLMQDATNYWTTRGVTWPE